MRSFGYWTPKRQRDCKYVCLWPPHSTTTPGHVKHTRREHHSCPGARCSLSLCAARMDPELPFSLLHIQGRTECHHLVLAPRALAFSMSPSANRDRCLFSSWSGAAVRWVPKDEQNWVTWEGLLMVHQSPWSISLYLCTNAWLSFILLIYSDPKVQGLFPSARFICLLNLKNVLNFSYIPFLTLSRGRGVHPSAFLPIAGWWYHFIEEKL